MLQSWSNLEAICDGKWGPWRQQKQIANLFSKDHCPLKGGAFYQCCTGSWKSVNHRLHVGYKKCLGICPLYSRRSVPEARLGGKKNIFKLVVALPLNNRRGICRGQFIFTILNSLGSSFTTFVCLFCYMPSTSSQLMVCLWRSDLSNILSSTALAQQWSTQDRRFL